MTERIIVGPWRGEVGTEVTYWMPFVAKAAQFIPNFWSRAVVVSRGGMGRLYHPDVETVDLYGLRGVKEVFAENLTAKSEFGVNKPLKWTEWELGVVNDIARQHGRVTHFHPMGMTAICARSWEGVDGWQTIGTHLDNTPIQKPPKPTWLPKKYIAMKWYHREGQIDDDVTYEWSRIVHNMDMDDIVWVGDGYGYDRHVDGHPAGCLWMPDGPAEDNLYRQAAVIAHADKFVGTYGGTAQLALRLGVPTVAFYPGREPRHRAWNQLVADQTGVPFVSGSLSDLPLMRSVLA